MTNEVKHLKTSKGSVFLSWLCCFNHTETPCGLGIFGSVYCLLLGWLPMLPLPKKIKIFYLQMLSGKEGKWVALPNKSLPSSAEMVSLDGFEIRQNEKQNFQDFRQDHDSPFLICALRCTGVVLAKQCHPLPKYCSNSKVHIYGTIRYI